MCLGWYCRYMSWEIETYKTSSGQEVVEDFIYRLQKSTKAKLVRQLEMLQKYGPELSMPRARPMGNGLYELRVRGKQEVRVFYIYVQGRRIFLLHAFQKKSQETPKKELEIARQRQAEVKI
jgi:phage-related protein